MTTGSSGIPPTVGPADIMGWAGFSAPPHEVTAAEVLGNVQQQVTVNELSATQQAGMYLAKGVGALIVAVTLIAVINYVWFAPSMPTLPEDATAAKAVIENHRALSDAYVTQSSRIFELIVASALLPVFTAILGYIFGTQTSAQGPPR